MLWPWHAICKLGTQAPVTGTVVVDGIHIAEAWKLKLGISSGQIDIKAFGGLWT